MGSLTSLARSGLYYLIGLPAYSFVCGVLTVFSAFLPKSLQKKLDKNWTVGKSYSRLARFVRGFLAMTVFTVATGLAGICCIVTMMADAISERKNVPLTSE